MNLKMASKGIVSISVKMVVYILIVAATFELAKLGYETGEKVFSDKGYKEAPGKNISVTVTSDMSTMDVAKILEDKGIIEDKYIFFIQSFLYEGDFKEGKYKLNTSTSPEDIINILSSENIEGENK